jgi:hypothetical protein
MPAHPSQSGWLYAICRASPYVDLAGSQMLHQLHEKLAAQDSPCAS